MEKKELEKILKEDKEVTFKQEYLGKWVTPPEDKKFNIRLLKDKEYEVTFKIKKSNSVKFITDNDEDFFEKRTVVAYGEAEASRKAKELIEISGNKKMWIENIKFIKEVETRHILSMSYAVKVSIPVDNFVVTIDPA